jgi:hypothetical protein
MVLFTTFVQTKFRPYSLYCFSKYKMFKQKFNVLNTVFSKQNISCFEIRWPRPIWSVNVFFMHSASAVDIYRAQRKHINYSIWPMRISRHDLRRRYSNLLVIDAGSQFSLRACSAGYVYEEKPDNFSLPRSLVPKLVVPAFGQGKFVRVLRPPSKTWLTGEQSVKDVRQMFTCNNIPSTQTTKLVKENLLTVHMRR